MDADKRRISIEATRLMMDIAPHAECDGKGCPGDEYTGIDPQFLVYGLNGAFVVIHVPVAHGSLRALRTENAGPTEAAPESGE